MSAHDSTEMAEWFGPFGDTSCPALPAHVRTIGGQLVDLDNVPSIMMMVGHEFQYEEQERFIDECGNQHRVLVFATRDDWTISIDPTTPKVVHQNHLSRVEVVWDDSVCGFVIDVYQD